jgi:drug/metabolite transporter (DMT)-like permease
MNKTQNIKLAVVFALSASLCNTIMSVFVKLIGTAQNTNMVTFSRFALGLLILLPWFLTNKNSFSAPHKTKLFLRSITTLLAMSCVFYSLKYIPVTNALLLNNTFPLFMPILVLLFLKTKTPAKMWGGIIIGFIGVTLVLQPHLNTFNWASLIALASGLLSALAVLQIRLLAGNTTPQQILFFMFLFCAILSGITLPFSIHAITIHDLMLLFFVGLFGAGYQLFLTLALQYASARIVSPLFFSSILFAALFDWFIWQHTPNLEAITGMLLVIVGGLATVFLAESKHH